MITKEDIREWCVSHMHELNQVAPGACTIEIICHDGGLAFQVWHQALGYTGAVFDMEDAKRILVTRAPSQFEVATQPEPEQTECVDTDNPF